ncbi:MAG: phage tail tape measure protein, partial [Phycisphaerae bacterium]|nr:phage tail tape measure protein [Phycisphaerae bacterium]
RAFVELGVSDKLTAGLKRAQKRLQAFGEGLRSIGTRVAAIGAGILAPLFASTKLFANIGDSLDEMSARTGVSVEALSELGLAAELSGADLETLEIGLRKMQKAITEAAGGSKSAIDALAQLGLNVQDLVNLSPEQQFKLIADRISKIEDPTRKAALALEVFGKSGTRLLPMIQDGAKGLEAFQEQARRLGLTISTQTAKDAALLADSLDILWRVLKQGVFIIGSALARTVRDLANAVTRTVVTITDWIKRNRELVVWVAKIAAIVAVAGVTLIALGYLVSGIAAAFGTLATIAAGVGTALGVVGSVLAAMVSPIGLVITAVVALGGTLLVVTGAGADALAWLGEQFQSLKATAMKVVGGIADALAAGDIALAAQILWLSLKLAWQQGVAALNRVWLEAKRFFISTAQKMWFGALAAAETVFHAFEVAWIETTAFLSKTWTSFTSGFQKAWNTAINWTTKRLLELWGLFDETLDVEAAKKMADQDLADLNTAIDRQREAALAEREAQRKQQRERAGEEHDATLAEIGRQLDEAEKRLEGETDAKIAETRRALAEARRQLDEAIAQAKKRREEAEKGGGPPRRRIGDPLEGLEDRLAGIGDALAQKISVTGTFSAAAVHGLGTGSDAMERTARASEQTARHTKRLAEAASIGGLTFA